MKFQWNLLLGLLFAIIIAVFAVFNVEQFRLIMFLVSHNGHSSLLFYVQLYWCCGQRTFRDVSLVSVNRRIKELMKEMTMKELTIAAQQNEIAELQKYTALPSNKEIENGYKKICKLECIILDIHYLAIDALLSVIRIVFSFRVEAHPL